jgi:hypothetical protein
MLRELATTCPRNREDLQAACAAPRPSQPPPPSPCIWWRAIAPPPLNESLICFCSYLHIVRSFAGGKDAAPVTGYGLATAGMTAAAIIKVIVLACASLTWS